MIKSKEGLTKITGDCPEILADLEVIVASVFEYLFRIGMPIDKIADEIKEAVADALTYAQE